MAKKGQAPSMADAAVKAATGKDWKSWFALLDKAKAQTLGHKAIVTFLSDKHGVPSWWRQMVTVEYERARGLRARHQTATGYSVSASKTVSADLATLYAAAADAKTRAKWFPKGAFKPSSQTKEKYYRGSWNGSARLEIGFFAKGPAKAQIAVQIGKLKNKAAVDTERTAWKAALTRLDALLRG